MRPTILSWKGMWPTLLSGLPHLKCNIATLIFFLTRLTERFRVNVAFRNMCSHSYKFTANAIVNKLFTCVKHQYLKRHTVHVSPIT